MQQKSERRSNVARSDATRAALLDAARTLFVEKGYAETGTPELVEAAGVTRGALYHHFADKRALLLALVEAEAEAVARAVDQASTTGSTPAQMLHLGAVEFLSAMQLHGRTRLLLIDAPSVLGFEVVAEIDGRHGKRTLIEGLSAALDQPADAVIPLADMLSAAFDRAALSINAGMQRAAYEAALSKLIDGVLLTCRCEPAS